MNYRIAKILAEKSLDSAGVETIDLNVVDAISRIMIRYKGTRSLMSMSAQPAADITKIELVEGSEVLHNLSGLQNQALCIYDRKVPSMNHGQHYIGNSEESSYGIDFGRYLWDPEFAFLPSRFRNPQLRITYNSLVCDPGMTSPLIEVIGMLFDEKQVSPRGFLMAKEIYNAACPAENAYKYVDLPTDYPIRQMIIRGYHDGHEPWDSVKGVKLDEDNEKRIPFDWLIEEYHRIMKGVWPPVEELVVGYATVAGTDIYITPSDYWSVILAMGATASDPVYDVFATVGGKATLHAASNVSFKGIARGWLPNHCVQFPFGRPEDPDDWYDNTKLGSCRLRVQGGASGISGAFQVVLQQARLY